MHLSTGSESSPCPGQVFQRPMCLSASRQATFKLCVRTQSLCPAPCACLRLCEKCDDAQLDLCVWRTRQGAWTSVEPAIAWTDH